MIAEHLPHAGLILAVWVVGGLLSTAGAFANAELSAMIPHAGGDYVYLREAFHPGAGFLVGWLSFFAIYAGTVATLAVGFAASLGAMFGWGKAAVLGTAVLTIVLTSWLNWVGVRWGARANNLTGWVKVAALTLFCVAAPFTGRAIRPTWCPWWRGSPRRPPRSRSCWRSRRCSSATSGGTRWSTWRAR